MNADEMIEKLIQGMDPKKAKTFEVKAFVVYEGQKGNAMFMCPVRSLGDLFHAHATVKALTETLGKIIQEGHYTPEEMENMQDTPVRHDTKMPFGKPFAEA